jgi:hypothetical protein
MIQTSPSRLCRQSFTGLETLENRQLLSLVVDLRVPGGAKAATVSSVGQVIKLEAWATVKGSNTVGTDEGLQDVWGSFISKNVTGGAANGTLKATRTAPFNGTTSMDGMQKDLDGDGDLDVGGTSAPDENSGFFLARSNLITKTGGTISGGSHSFKIADLTFTVTSLKTGTQTELNFVPRPSKSTFPSWITAVWMEDGVRKSTFLSSNTIKGFTAGSPVVLKRGATSSPGSISGNVFKDVTGNGIKDSGDTNATSWRVYLDSNKNGIFDSASEKSVLTDGFGNYKLSSLAAGTTYRVRPITQSGYRISTPTAGFYDVGITSGLNATGKNFGVTQRVLITGTIFNDANKNKIKDSTEGGLGAWRVYIDSNNNKKFDSTEVSTLTDSAGNFRFVRPAGSFIIRVVQPSTYTRTTASENFTFSLANGGTKSGLLFGEKKIA